MTIHRIAEENIASSSTLDIDALINALCDKWINDYLDSASHSPCICEIPIKKTTFIFDQTSASTEENTVEDRLVAAYGFSVKHKKKRDASRIRGFIGGRIDIPNKGKFDKGHALSHAMGGGLDINLFPQKPALNRGHSKEGRTYRRMEKYAADHPGTFVFSRLFYTDNSWVPSALEYGVLMPDGTLWVEWFEN
ncbi:MAG TPA: hypothetical protein VJ001_00920 [Rhodocyclaceae bacterium]|nr:hypothetical protein [Rhodocyclaceae bacterium]